MFSYVLGPYPLSLATTVGNMRKITKSKLLHIFESEFPECVVDVNAVTADGSVLIDAMAIIQSTVVVPETYGEFSDNILSKILAIARKFKAVRVDF